MADMNIVTRFFFTGSLLLPLLVTQAQRQMEYLTRGVYAVNEGKGKIFVSWRLLGVEPADIAFNLYRSTDGKTIKLNKEPLTKGTNYTDESADAAKANTYIVKSILQGKEQAAG